MIARGLRLSVRNLGFTLVLCAATVSAAAARTGPDVARFARFEVPFGIPDQAGNPFDPRDNEVNVVFRGPRHLRDTVPAFWDGARWRVRYTPTRPGRYSLRISRNGQPEPASTLPISEFECVTGNSPGFIRRDRRIAQRFVFDDGEPYYPLGMNAAWSGRGLEYRELLAGMGRARMNWARVWMTFWDGKALNWSPDRSKYPERGYLLTDAAERLDAILDEAEKNGIYIQLTLQHHGQYTGQTDPNWRDNPFNVANGGFLRNPDDFFVDPEAKRLTRNMYRYIVARWGYSTHLMAWELFNEVQNIGEASTHFQDVVEWHREMAAWIRSLDVNHHLITTSLNIPGTPLGSIGLDYYQLHGYPSDVIALFESVRTDGLSRPLFYGEWGPGDGTPLTRDVLHEGLWASLMAPTAGAGQFWYWDQVSDKRWWSEFRSASDYVQWSQLARNRPLKLVRVSVQAAGDRVPLEFGLPGEWTKTTRREVTLPPDGQPPDLHGLSAFIQGAAHRDMLPGPIRFRVRCAEPGQFRVELGVVARAGASALLKVDDNPAQQVVLPGAPRDHPAGRDLVAGLTPGDHVVSVFNDGADWYTIRRITVTHYAPSVGAAARASEHSVYFWAFRRTRETARASAALEISGLRGGRYLARIWDTREDRELLPVPASPVNGRIVVRLPPFGRDIAGVVVPVSSVSSQ